MSEIRQKYKNQTVEAYGRHGFMKQTGVHIMKHDDKIHLRAINTRCKDVSGSVVLQIPKEELEVFILNLQSLL